MERVRRGKKMLPRLLLPSCLQKRWREEEFCCEKTELHHRHRRRRVSLDWRPRLKMEEEETC